MNNFKYSYQSKNSQIDNYKLHYIAYIDIVAYENLIERNDNEFFPNIYTAIGKAIESFKLTIKFLNLILSNVTLKYKIFSDNIILFVEQTNDTQIDMINLCSLMYCAKCIQFSLISYAKVFVRGGICKGKLYSDAHFIYGKGLVDVVNLEKRAKFPRIAISEEIIKDLNLLRFDINIKNTFVDSQLLYKKRVFISKINRLILDSRPGYSRNYYFESMHNILNSCMMFLQNKNSDDFRIKEKFVFYLEDFFNDIKENIVMQANDNVCFINYLYSNSTMNEMNFQNLQMHEETFYIQLKIAKQNDKYEYNLKEKYEWIAEYHNSFCNNLFERTAINSTLYLSI